MYKSVTAEAAVKVIKSNDRVYVQAAAAAPQELVRIAHPDFRENLDRDYFQTLK